MNKKTSEWLTKKAFWRIMPGFYQANLEPIACGRTIERWFDIPRGSEIQLRLSRARQNSGSKRLSVKRSNLFAQSIDTWGYRQTGRWRRLSAAVEHALDSLYPNAQEGDTHRLWLTCWYREAGTQRTAK